VLVLKICWAAFADVEDRADAEHRFAVWDRLDPVEQFVWDVRSPDVKMAFE